MIVSEINNCPHTIIALTLKKQHNVSESPGQFVKKYETTKLSIIGLGTRPQCVEWQYLWKTCIKETGKYSTKQN